MSAPTSRTWPTVLCVVVGLLYAGGVIAGALFMGVATR